MNWHTADWHMGHQNPKHPEKGVIEYCGRPFSHLTGMHETIRRALLSHIKPGDTLYVHGDCWLYWDKETAKRFMDQIPARKILIRGNHDRWGKKKMMDCGFDEVHKFLEIEIAGKRCLCTHDPVVACVKDVKDMVVLNGHVHQLWRTFGRCINVGVDIWNFAPVSEDVLIPFVEEAAREDWLNHKDNPDQYHSQKVGK